MALQSFTLRFGLLLALSFGSTNLAFSSELSENQLKQLAQHYFATYSLREDFEQLMSFYADNAQLEDVIYGNRAVGINAIREFLDWERGDFKLLDGQQILTVEHQSYGANRVVAEGYFHRFSYQGSALGPWRFVILLDFNDEGKIIRHIDWINYTPRKEFLGGQNLNPPVDTTNQKQDG